MIYDLGNIEELRIIMHRLRTLSGQFMPFKELTFAEYGILRKIGKTEQETGKYLTSTELNQVFGTKPPATSRIITFLEKKGYLFKKVAEEDHRILYLEITEAGKKILEEEAEVYIKLTGCVVKRMGREDVDQMISLLTKFGNILKEEVANFQTDESHE